MAVRFYDSELVLRDIADGAETATAAETGIAFDALKGGDFKAVVNVSSIDGASGNETYTIGIETDTTTAFGSATEVGRLSLTHTSSTGTYEIPLSAVSIRQEDAGAGAIRCKLTAGGTSPSITYGCYLSPLA